MDSDTSEPCNITKDNQDIIEKRKKIKLPITTEWIYSQNKKEKFTIVAFVFFLFIIYLFIRKVSKMFNTRLFTPGYRLVYS